jgi:hypothetical protein
MTTLINHLTALTDDELRAVLLNAAATFADKPRTKEEAIARSVFLAAAAESVARGM